MIKTILLDCDGVLHDNRKRLEGQADSVRRFFPGKKIGEIIADYFAVHQEIHELAPDKHDDLAEHFSRLSRRYGQMIDAEQALAAAQVWQAAYDNYQPIIFPDVISFLQAARDLNLPVFLVSGSTEAERKKLLAMMGINELFQGVFAANSVGAQKQDIKFYEKVLAEIKVNPEQTLIIGDQYNDDISAGRVGIKTVLLNRPGSQRAPNTSGVEPDWEVGSLAEVLPILRGERGQEKEKLVYVLPRYDRKTDTHLNHLYDFISRLAKVYDLFLIVESGGQPEIENVKQWVKLPDGFGRRLFSAYSHFRSLRRQGYRKVYIHYSYPAVIMARLAGLSVFYWNCGHIWLFSGFKNKIFFPWLLKFVDCLVTGTNFMADGYAKHTGIRRDKIKVMPNWIEVKRWQSQGADQTEIRRKLNLPKTGKIVTFVHRLAPRKGSDYLPAIARELAADQDVYLLIIGDGPDRDLIRTETAKLENSGRILILGAVPNQQLPEYLAASDVFIMPSREEGFPRVAIEAMAAGVPVVAFDTGGLEEILAPSLLANIVKPDDVPAFVQRIWAALAEFDRVKRQELAAFAGKFDIDRVAERFKEIV